MQLYRELSAAAQTAYADYQFFRAGGLLVGTHAFLAVGNQLGVA